MLLTTTSGLEYGSEILQYLTIIPRARVGYEMIDSQRGAELAIIISYPTNANGIIFFINNNQEMLLDHADFALQEQAENNLMVVFS